MSLLAERGHRVIGLDRSRGMLANGRDPALRGLCTRGTAEHLPFCDASFDRVVAVNALHHFSDPLGFIREAKRLLAAGGGFLSVGLDPHTGLDRWSIYDYFPAALELDRVRYAPTARIRGWLQQLGFAASETRIALHAPIERPALELLESGGLDPHVTSQLSILTREQYDAGIAQIRRDAAALAARGETLTLHSDLRLFATAAWT